jgi:hypothetical protein
MDESKQAPYGRRGNDSFSVPLAVEVSSDGSGGYHQIEGHAVLLCIVYCAMPFLQCCAARTVGEMEAAHTWLTARCRYNCRVASVIY